MARGLVAGAVIRAALAALAIPLAPFLYREHFLILTVMRPTKEVLLAGGFLSRKDSIGVLELSLAAIPLLLGGVWLFFALGKVYGSKIVEGQVGGRIVQALMPSKKIKQLSKVLETGGARVIFLGRLAAFPSSAVAAAAGSADMPTRTFLLADGLGGLTSLAMTIGIGFAFGAAYRKAGPWLTVLGVVALLAGMVAIGRLLRRA